MHVIKKTFQFSRTCLLCVFFIVELSLSNFIYADSQLQDFGDPQANNLWGSLHKLEDPNQGVNVPTLNSPKLTPNNLRIMQLGDSHTAADYFTGRLRSLLQNRFGNAGIGWLTPGAILYQRAESVNLKNVGKWQIKDAKKLTDNGQFPLGGFFSSINTNGIIELSFKNSIASGPWQLNLWQKSSSTPWRLMFDNGTLLKFPSSSQSAAVWQITHLTLSDSQLTHLRLLAPSNAQLGGIVVDRNTPGITLDALGNNGSVVNIISKWDEQSLQQQLRWRNPQLIILAYGTNEAFDTQFNIPDYETELHRNIQRLRNAAPNAAILLMGLPSSIKKNPPNISLGCIQGSPPSFMIVQQLQQKVAQAEHTLYWNWSEMMGGPCAPEKWINAQPALMRPDLIHMTQEGYQLSADAFYDALMKALQKWIDENHH